MNVKIFVACLAIVVAVVFGSMSFMENNVEYGSFQAAIASHKKIQVKGVWDREKPTRYDARSGQFIFYMKDDNDQEEMVILDGARPNNFEVANSIVAKGRYREGSFYASDVLTKCPSKYEGDSETLKKTI
jgi:cytochrome c-type biogenesis protein CcmE